jgi:hypothetical protein
LTSIECDFSYDAGYHHHLINYHFCEYYFDKWSERTEISCRIFFVQKYCSNDDDQSIPFVAQSHSSHDWFGNDVIFLIWIFFFNRLKEMWRNIEDWTIEN